MNTKRHRNTECLYLRQHSHESLKTRVMKVVWNLLLSGMKCFRNSYFNITVVTVFKWEVNVYVPVYSV